VVSKVRMIRNSVTLRRVWSQKNPRLEGGDREG